MSQVRDHALRPIPVVPIATPKRVATRTGAEMTCKRLEHACLDSIERNPAGRCPVSEVRRTSQDELARPAFVARRAQPIGKPVDVQADRTLPQLTLPEIALDVVRQHRNLLGIHERHPQEACLRPTELCEVDHSQAHHQDWKSLDITRVHPSRLGIFHHSAYPRPLQENATSRSVLHALHWNRANPPANDPHVRSA